MANADSATLPRPNVNIDPRVQTELGLSLGGNVVGTVTEAGRLGLGWQALRATEITFSADKVTQQFADAKEESIRMGQAEDNKVTIFMGSVAARAQEIFADPNNTRSLDALLSILTSFVLEHELSHVADSANMGRKRLEREDMRYERRRLTRASLPGVGAIAGHTVITGAVVLGASFLEALPWWMKAAVGAGSLYQYKDIVSGIRKARRKAREHTYNSGEKVYANHPCEKRAFGNEVKYAKRLLNGDAPLLVSVSQAKTS